MTPLRRRAAALTCAALASVAVAGTTSAEAATTAPTSAPLSVTASTGVHTSVDVSPALLRGRPGLSRLVGTAGVQRAIVTLEARPTTRVVAALEALGLTVRPMERLPMAVVEGPTAALVQAVADGIGRDVYPDEVLSYADTASTDTMSTSPKAAQRLRARGLTGKGVTVGVVDSGCDATHPDLAERVVHNVTLVSPEYLNAGTSPILAVPLHEAPYSNTDLGSGHGTHVAGIVAADGTSGSEFLGVAPDAELACFAIGAVITTTAVVTAYDYALSQPDMLGIDVFNNSWGNSFRQYDPADPVNVATRAVTRQGAVVVFSAGNSGAEDAEASVSPFNQAPWVISVAAGTVGDRQRGSFSSNGLEFDNATAKPIGADGHTVHKGDRFGLTQPDLMAPGVSISSSCDSTGSVIGPCPDHGNTTASGTSMSAPHVAGAAAVLVQANKRLSPAQVQQALKATAGRVRGEDGVLNSFQVGYGHVNLDRAVALVKGKKGKALTRTLKRAMRKADRRLARQDEWAVTRTDQWQEDALPVAVGPIPYAATHEIRVGRRTDAVKLAVVYPSPTTVANVANVVATLVDPDGTVVGSTETDVAYAHGTSSGLFEDLEPGTYTIEVDGFFVSDPDTLDSDSINGRVVFLSASQLRRR